MDDMEFEFKDEHETEYVRKKHYWWRYLLVFITGMITTVLVAVFGVIYLASSVTTDQLIILTGLTPESLLTENYRGITLIQFFTEAASGKIDFSTLGGIASVTPLVDTTIDFVNDAIDDFLGFTFDKTELYDVKFADLGEYVLNEALDESKVSYLLKADSSSADVVQYLSFPKNDDGTYDYENSYSVRYLMDHASDLIDGYIDSVHLNEIVDCSANSLLTYLGPYKLGELTDAVTNCPLSEVIDVDSSSPYFLQNLVNEGVTVGNLSDRMNSLVFGDLVSPSDAEGNIFFKYIDPSTPIDQLADAVQNLKIVEVYEDNIFVTNSEGLFIGADTLPLTDQSDLDARVLDNAWKYLLTESDEHGVLGKGKLYTIGGDMGQLIENMNWHIKNECIRDLNESGYISLNAAGVALLDVKITDKIPTETSYGDKTFGDLTTSEFVAISFNVIANL